MKTALENRIAGFQDRKIAERNMEDLVRNIPGWGMDADPDNDPTYPVKQYNGADHQRFDYERAPQQDQNMEILQSIERPAITRVFGTSTPPSGLSGAVRRYAYRFSEANAAHWMTLVLADRINAIEGKIEDLKQGIVPNPWIERGWRAEWKHNRLNFIGRAATVALVLGAGIMLMRKGKKHR